MPDKNIVLLDADCALCNKSAAFIMQHSNEEKFSFLSLYKPEAKQLLKKHGLPEDYTKSLVLIKNEKAYLKSDAALKIARELNGGWPLFYSFIVIPRFIRDAFYNLIARHRHFFNKK